MDSESLRPYIDWYKSNFSSIFERLEGYKWRSVQTFQKLYSPDKIKYSKTLKDCFSKSKNLLNSQSVFSLGMLQIITNSDRKLKENNLSGKDIFFNLFEGISPKDSGEELLQKISSFRYNCRSYVREFFPDKNNDYQDLHAVSVYLSHRYPDCFYMYKASVFEEFNNLIGNEFLFKWGSNSNYLAYQDMCGQVNSILRHEIELDEGFYLAVEKSINSSSEYYADPEYTLLTQDFIYSVVRYYKMDLTGRYSKQMKQKFLNVQPDYICVEDLAPDKDISHIPSETTSFSKIDYVLRQQKNIRLGAAGEQWVVEYEKKKLRSLGLKSLANKVKWVSQKDDSKGYDILSYDKNGKELYIEVKTTTGGERTPFYLSSLEMSVSHSYSSKYQLYRVYDFNKDPKILVIVGDLSKLNPQPTNYIIFPK